MKDSPVKDFTRKEPGVKQPRAKSPRAGDPKVGDVILKVTKLQKTYPNGMEALKEVSFQVERGEFLAIIGLSGSGKSTLLRCLNRLHDPSGGQIFFQGREVSWEVSKLRGREIKKVRQKMAMIFQHFHLIGRHSVLKNVLVGSLSRTSNLTSILGFFSKEEKERAHKYLDLVGIGDKAFQRADQLSGGQQQRVAIARALTQFPEILLADEPVASLDPATCHRVMDYLRKVNRELGLTILCNLHFLSLVKEYADRVLALKDGKIVYQGKPTDIDENWFEQIYGRGAREVQVQA